MVGRYRIEMLHELNCYSGRKYVVKLRVIGLAEWTRQRWHHVENPLHAANTFELLLELYLVHTVAVMELHESVYQLVIHISDWYYMFLQSLFFGLLVVFYLHCAKVGKRLVTSTSLLVGFCV